jgi:hypothetical protein
MRHATSSASAAIASMMAAFPNFETRGCQVVADHFEGILSLFSRHVDCHNSRTD